MHPIIFNFGGLHITSWGVMVVIGFIIGVWFAEKRAKSFGIEPIIISNLSIILIISGVIGGRIAYVIENIDYYSQNLGEILKVWEGGLIFYGGFVFAFIFGIIFLKYKKVKITKVMDIIAPSIALGLVFARIGCFLNGCCFGKPTDLPWGVVFPINSPAGNVFPDTHIHPTQIYSSIANLIIFFILIKSKIKFSSYLFVLFIFLYSIWRFFVDFLRYYENKVYVIDGLTHNQIFSIIICLVSFILIIIFSKKR